MRQRETSKKSCKTCGYAFWDKEKEYLLCQKTQKETTNENVCKSYIYDIYKYEPKKGVEFSGFKKEDFEI